LTPQGCFPTSHFVLWVPTFSELAENPISCIPLWKTFFSCPANGILLLCASSFWFEPVN
jgi:hypothetical protein